MKVLIINHFPLVGSGSGTYTRNIAVHLQKKGHDVCIVLPENTTDYEKIHGIKAFPVFFKHEEDIEGMLPFNFPCFTTHPRSTMTFYDMTDDEIDMYLSAFEDVITQAVAEFEPDIIHGQHIWLLSWLAIKTGIPYVVTAHGTDLMGYKKGERFRKYAKETASGAKRIITISNDNNALVSELFPDSASKAIFMQNGYDTDRFYPAPISNEQIEKEFGIKLKKKLVLFVGKLADFKGVDIFIEAIRLYEEKYPDEIVTLIAGAGELEATLKKQAKDANLDSLHFLGHLDSRQLRELYSSVDVSVFPSRREPFGLVVIEALACGSLVIGTNQGGHIDIVNDEVGTLVPVEDAPALAEAIHKEIYHPDRVARGKAAAKYALENYAQGSLMDTLINIYQIQ
ncbi:MAG: glycosyltransferase family 4 protein [Oscillospiraceae bacterium]|jgi:glycosyltransferase involved in cell wall biosynthesis|nr:glycosyltransferase family 4 protein [Oscillospiraceae bacterium]